MDFRSVFILLFVVGVAYAARISGGSDAVIESYPMAVQVERSVLGILWELNCAGSIINRRYVLTAAQCFYGPLYEFFSSRIRHGTGERGTGGEVAYIQRVITHPSFDQDTFDNDIALVHLSSDLIYNERTQAGTITAAGFQLPENIPVIMIGWGDVNAFTGAESLQELATATMNREVCADRLNVDEDSEEDEQIISTMTPDLGTEATTVVTTEATTVVTTEAATEAVTEAATTETATDATTEAATEAATTEVATDVTIEAATDAATTETATDVTTEAATTEAAIDATTEAATESAITEEATDATTEADTEAATTEEATDATTEAATETETTEAATDATTELATEAATIEAATTDAATEVATTEAATDATTEAATEGATNSRKVNPWIFELWNTQRSRELTENMMCVGDLVSWQSRGACDGDVGGPVLLRQTVGDVTTDIIVGIISWANGCGFSNQPTVATAVTMYTNWIVENVVQ